MCGASGMEAWTQGISLHVLLWTHKAWQPCMCPLPAGPCPRPHLLHQSAAIRQPQDHALTAAIHVCGRATRLRSPHEQPPAPQLNRCGRAVGGGDVEAAAMLQHDFGDLGGGGSTHN